MHIAIIGCGQLSRMLALAGIPLGFKFSFVADVVLEDLCCVDGLGEIVRWQPGSPISDLYTALGKPDVVTTEKEQIDLSLLEAMQKFCLVYPTPRAFGVCQHRFKEKQLLDKLGIACSPYTYGKVLSESAQILGLPIVLKSCRDGYDGKSQWVLKSQFDIESFQQSLILDDFISEQWIPFEKEVSLISVRALSGEIRHYSLTENYHENGILKQSVAPAINVDAALAKQAKDNISRIMNELDYVGVMAMECFVSDGCLLVNELAPRVHNSGHWTQSGSATSQFENHLRAIAGLPLGSTDIHSVSSMVNLIGTHRPPLSSLTEHSTLHWYNKSVREGRKLGHVNFTASNHIELGEQVAGFQKKLLTCDQKELVK